MTSHRASATRVVDAQRQTAPMLGIAVVFTLAAPVATLVPHDTGMWLPLHLFLVGGLVSAITGVTQMLAVTWSAAPAPTDRLASLQRWSMVIGVLGIAAGRELDRDPVVGAGGVAVALVIGSLGTSLVRIRSGGTTRRFHPAIDGYLMASAWALVGIFLGILLSTAEAGEWWNEILAVHIAVNAFGFVGVIIASTLPYFVATQARMKMSRRATPARLRGVPAAMATAVGVIAAGHLTELNGLAGVGYSAYVVGLAGLVVILPSVGRRQLRWAGPRLLQLGLGMGWWAGAVAWLALVEFGLVTGRSRALLVVAVGGFAQILVASLAYLAPVVRAGGHRRLGAGFATTRSWTSLVAANVAAAGLAIGSDIVAFISIGLWALDVLARAIALSSSRQPDQSQRGT